MKQKFKTRLNRNSIIAIYGGILILALCIGLPLLLTPKEELYFAWPMLFPAAIVSFFIFIIGKSFLKSFLHFIVSDQGIRIKIPLLRNKLFSKQDIESIRILNTQETHGLFEAQMEKQMEIQESGDLFAYFSMIKNKSHSFAYLSVSPMVKTTSTGAKEHITSMKIKVDERIIELKLNNGEIYYLAPVNIDSFYKLATS